MEEKDYEIIAAKLLQDAASDLRDSEFYFLSSLTILTLLLEKGIITEEEFKGKLEGYKNTLKEK